MKLISYRVLRIVCWLGLAAALAAPAAPPVTRTEIRLPDVEGYRTLKCDLHLHTVFSDGDVWPTWRVTEAWRDGLDAIALTDHIEYQPKTNDIPTRHQRPFDIARGPAATYGIILIRGAEITKAVPPGHFNAIFVTNIDAIAHEDVAESLRRAVAQGAFVFWNHPGWRVPDDQPTLQPIHRELLAEKLFHGIELFNDFTPYTNVWTWAFESGLTPLGNSDYHTPVDPPLPRHAGHRTLTLVFARERTEAGVREALFAGRALVWDRERLIGRKEWLAPFVRACLTADPPHHRDGRFVWFYVRNGADISFTLRRVAGAGPAEILVPAGATVLVKYPLAAGASAEAVYEALNAESLPGEHPTLAWPLANPAR